MKTEIHLSTHAICTVIYAYSALARTTGQKPAASLLTRAEQPALELLVKERFARMCFEIGEEARFDGDQMIVTLDLEEDVKPETFRLTIENEIAQTVFRTAAATSPSDANASTSAGKNAGDNTLRAGTAQRPWKHRKRPNW